MNKYFWTVPFAALITACSLTSAPPKAEPPAAPPRVSGVDLNSIDAGVRPQDDFFRYVNGKWLANTQIPADKPAYGAFEQLRDQSERQLREIIEESVNTPDKHPGSDEQKVGDFYASFMNEPKIEKLGLKPLRTEFARIDALKSTDQIPALMAHLSRIGVDAPFDAGVGQDAKNSTQYIVYLGQSGLGLPDRDYYLSTDTKFKELRAQYRVHVARMLKLAGVKNPAEGAKDILALETHLAEKQWTRVENRDAEKTYNKFEVAKLNELLPGFGWDAYLQQSGIAEQPAVIIEQPSYFTGLRTTLKTTPLPVWRTYFKWRLLHGYSGVLDKAFVDESFDFYGKTLNGVPEIRPRWKRGVQQVQGALGEALGRIYVAKHFPPENKARMEKLVGNLNLAYKDSIGHLDWMSDETRQRALEKLSKFNTKIGYPNKWRDYSALTVDKDDLVGNVMRASEFEHNRQINKLGKPIDREEWLMTPQTVNAYYHPTMNEIVFPAAILQPPFFNMEADDAVNYGAIGAVIGHEIGHGFDDQGSKFDGDGNLKSWWTDDDRTKFEERTKQLIAQYDAYEPIKGFHVQGALTIGENIGDLGGLSIAYKAYKLSLNGNAAPVIDGLTGDQRFFMGWAQAWRYKYRDEALINLVKTNPHSPPEYRCNGVLVNVPGFYTAFGVKESDKMYKPAEQRVKIW